MVQRPAKRWISPLAQAALAALLLLGSGGCSTARPDKAAPPPVASSALGASVAPAQAARIVYDAKTHGYLDALTGSPVAPANIPWPPNDGFVTRTRGTLEPGTVVDRYGRPSGRYVGQPGATISQRGLPPGSEALEYHRYEVLQPLPADIGPAAGVAAFGATGGGTQYLLDQPIDKLIAQGYLREIP